MLKSTLLGFYEPSFFEMHVCTNECLEDINHLSPQSSSVFFHEYTHFLQDIITSFGLINLANVVNVQKALNGYICQQDSSFIIPIDWELVYPKVHNTSLAFDVYWGEHSSPFDSYAFVSNIGWENGPVKGFERRIHWIYIDYIRKGQHDKCYFGAYAIMESMAYLLESMICDKVLPAPDYPYHFVELLALYRYPEIAKDKILLILLCDIALNTYHPGKFLDEIMTRWARDKFMPNSYYEVYDYAAGYRFRDLCQNEYTFNELFAKSIDDGINAFSDYFTIHDFDSVKNWGVKLMKTAQEIRNKQPYFWVDILQKTTPQERREEFYKLFLIKLGTPLMVNDLNECFFIPHNIYQGDVNLMSILRAIKELRNYLTEPDPSCSLTQYCEKTIDISQMDCKNPWNIFLRKDYSTIQLCPFCTLLKAWGIFNKQPLWPGTQMEHAKSK